MPTDDPVAPDELTAPDGHAEDLALVMIDLARTDLLPWRGDPEPVSPRRVLLTGATGFLGGHMLLDPLTWSAEVQRRVTALPGDLRRPQPGLTDEQWELMAVELDSLVSVGTTVDVLRGYPSLRRTNVLGMLSLAESREG